MLSFILHSIMHWFKLILLIHSCKMETVLTRLILGCAMEAKDAIFSLFRWLFKKKTELQKRTTKRSFVKPMNQKNYFAWGQTQKLLFKFFYAWMQSTETSTVHWIVGKPKGRIFKKGKDIVISIITHWRSFSCDVTTFLPPYWFTTGGYVSTWCMQMKHK